MKIKKLVAMIVAGVITFAGLSGCAGEKNEKVKIGVIQIVEHPSLNTIRDSFTERMKELGYVDGENAEFDYKSANGEVSTANSIINGFVGDKKDIIVAIATPTALAAANVADEIPVVFSAVTDPVGAGLVDSLESTGKNITGTSDAIPVEKILDLALEITPDIKTLGYLYNTGEANSISCLEKVKTYCEEHNIELVEGGVMNTSEVNSAVTALAGKSDAIFTPIDNTIASAMTTVADTSKELKIPVYVGADSMVSDGGLATIGIQYDDLGKETANMAASILKGEKKASEIPVKVFNEDLSIFINQTTADEIGVTLPDNIKNGEETVIFN